MLLQSSRFLSRSAATKTCRAATHHLRCCYNSNQPSSSASRTRPPLDPASPATTSICTKVMPAGDESAATAGDGFTSNNVTPVKDEIEPTQSLAEQCERVHKRVYEFLERKTGSSRVEQVQRQTRESLAVVEEALQKFRWAYTYTTNSSRRRVANDSPARMSSPSRTMAAKTV